MRTLWMLALVLALACGGDDGSSSSDPGDAPADAGPAPSGEWVNLLDSSWAVAAASEDYVCVRKTVERDTYIGGFRAIAPNGTHHTVLTVGAPTGPDGAESCNSFENHNTMIFGSGIGTSAFEMPDGVAVKVSAGQQLLLNLHLFNVGETELTGISGTEIREVAAEDVENEAEAVLMGPVQFSIPPGEQTVSGSCTSPISAKMFTIFPHMHQLGTHMKVDLATDSSTTTLHDAPYDFEAQAIYPIDPVDVAMGDRIDVTCTYVNHTGSNVGFGESSEAEMCFAGVYYYPAQGQNFFCSDF